ncbi:MAG: hypothetical protein JXQ73_04380 [Phycisphaerae bacterium]|nr:hypothetical protein [Phycisphaerae bacterium]
MSSIQLASLAICAALAGPGPAARDPVDLRGNWDFAYTSAHTDSPPPDDAFKTTVPVPGVWDDHLSHDQAKALWPAARFNPARLVRYPTKDNPPDASLPYLLGTGWYRKRIDVPTDGSNRQITLHVGRVVMQAWVYVNARQIHHHVGHSTTWEVPLTEHLHPGQTNELIIAVDNTDTARLGSIIRGYKGRSAGIFGPVRLDVAGATRIADLYVHQSDGGKLRWRVELTGHTPKNADLRWRIADRQTDKPLGQGRLPAAATTLEWSTDTFAMKPWSDRTPNLYRIEASLHQDSTCLDKRSQDFGLRRLTRHGFQLRLNDAPIFLRGICECSYYPETCTPPLDVDWYRRHVRRMKEVGFNWLRFHTSVPLEQYLVAADELGMLIQVEPPFGYEPAQWLDILRFCRKHPSVVIYCCGNEEVLDEAKIDFLHQCADDARKLVPDALFNPQEALRGVEYGAKQQFGQGLVAKPYPHNPHRLEALKQFSDVFGQYAWGTLSYQTLAGDAKWLDERLKVYERPCLSHEVGIIGSYLDLDLERRYASTRIGTTLFANIRESLTQAGLIDRAALYYRNSCAWQRLLFKDVIETARKTHRIAGYDVLGANDPHWHRYGYGCGVLNEFDELKPGDSVAQILRWNGQNVLLLDPSKSRNLKAGDAFKADLLISWFGPSTLSSATLRWRLRAEDDTALAQGEQAVTAIEPGSVAKIADVRLAVPSPTRPIKAHLEARLASPDGEIENAWPYWIFPAVNAPKPSAEVSIVRQLTADELGKLIRGGRVLLLGHKPLPARKTSFQMAVAGRPSGNLATVIADHPLMQRFPHDGYCAWQLRPMLDGGSAVVFDEMPKAFDPIIEVVQTYKNVSRQAAVFEWQVGKGRLLVCALNLPTCDPGAAYLEHCLLEYAASDQFDPKTRVAPQRLARLLKVPAPTLERLRKTDEAADPRMQKKPAP